MNPLITFIQNQLKLGVSREVITNQLMGQGWTSADINKAFISLEVPPVQPTPVMPPTPTAPTAFQAPSPSGFSQQPVYNAVQPQNAYPQKKKSHMGLMVSIIIVLLLLGGGAYAYFTFINPATSSKDILKKSVEAYINGNVKSFSFSATSTGQAKNQLGNGIPSSSDFTLTSNGSVDFHTPSAPLVNFDLGINVNVAPNNSFLLDLSTIYIDNNIYLGLKDFKLSFNPSSSDNLDPAEVAQAKSYVSIANNVAPSLQNKWIQFGVPTSVNTESPVPLSPQAQANDKMFQDYISGMSYITAINTIGTETIDNTSTYHIKMTIQGDQKLIDLLKSSGAMDKVTFAQMDDVSKVITQKFDLDIWIGKDDFLVYKIVSSPISITSTQANAKGTVTVTQEIVFSDYNKPMSIVAPEGAISFETLMKNMFGGTPVSPAVKPTTPAKVVTPTPSPVKVVKPVVVAPKPVPVPPTPKPVVSTDSNLITFDDLPTTTSGAAGHYGTYGSDTPLNYKGYQWSYFGIYQGVNTIPSGFYQGAVSPKNVAFNNLGQVAYIKNTTSFNLTSAYMTAAWNDNLQLTVEGYLSDKKIYSKVYTLSASSPTLVNFNFNGVDKVSFAATGGTQHSGYQQAGSQFAIDNVSITK